VPGCWYSAPNRHGLNRFTQPGLIRCLHCPVCTDSCYYLYYCFSYYFCTSYLVGFGLCASARSVRLTRIVRLNFTGCVQTLNACTCVADVTALHSYNHNITCHCYYETVWCGGRPLFGGYQVHQTQLPLNWELPAAQTLWQQQWHCECQSPLRAGFTQPQTMLSLIGMSCVVWCAHACAGALARAACQALQATVA
jgi:hypothetical protein